MNTSDIVTSQYVAITQTPAGVGERVLARLIDIFIVCAYIWALYSLLDYLHESSIINDFWAKHEDLRLFSWLALMVPAMFYTPLCEMFLNGQTFGKRIMRTRVVMADGSSLTMGAILLRWVFMLADIHFMCMGIIFIICTRRRQRLGDLAAGTMVIRQPGRTKIHLSLDEFYYATPDYAPRYPEVQQLSLGQIDVVQRMLHDTVVYSDEQVERLASKIERMLGVSRNQQDATEFLETILHDYQYYALEVV